MHKQTICNNASWDAFRPLLNLAHQSNALFRTSFNVEALATFTWKMIPNSSFNFWTELLTKANFMKDSGAMKPPAPQATGTRSG
jgi:hypothetical protein